VAKTTHKYESRILRSVHRSVAGLHRAGVVDKATMRKFDALRLPAAPPVAPEKIKARR
jgi:putative transcriptional regulator